MPFGSAAIRRVHLRSAGSPASEAPLNLHLVHAEVVCRTDEEEGIGGVAVVVAGAGSERELDAVDAHLADLFGDDAEVIGCARSRAGAETLDHHRGDL